MKAQPFFRGKCKEPGRAFPGRYNSMRASIVEPAVCSFLDLHQANVSHPFQFHDSDDVKKQYGNCPNGWPTAALVQQMHQEYFSFFDQGDIPVPLQSGLRHQNSFQHGYLLKRGSI
jgi:hypothetical protein